MDAADRAGELIEEREAEAIAAARWRHGESLSHCEDCGDEIPEPRRALGGIRRCVDCQGDYERRGV